MMLERILFKPWKKHRSKLLEERDHLLEEVLRLKDELSDRDRKIEELRKNFEAYLNVGPETSLMNNIRNIYHYQELYKKNSGNNASEIRKKLKSQLELVFKNSEAKQKYGVKYKGGGRVIYCIADSLDKILEIYDVEDVLLMVRHEDAKDASVPAEVYRHTRADIEKRLQVPNIPDTLQLDEFLIVREIVGPDTFTYFLEAVANANLSQEYKNRLEYADTKKHLDDAFYFLRTNFGFELEPSQCEEKLVGTFRKYTGLNAASEKGVREIGRLLDRISKYPFGDVTRWNTKRPNETAKLLLEKEWPDEEITRILGDKGLFHVDLYNLSKQTFVFDDYIQQVDGFGNDLTDEQKENLLSYFVSLISPIIKNAKDNLEYLSLWKGYRNLRSFYWQDVGKLPGPKEECKAHYLRNSFNGFYTHAFGRAPDAKELIDVSMDKVLESILAIQA